MSNARRKTALELATPGAPTNARAAGPQPRSPLTGNARGHRRDGSFRKLPPKLLCSQPDCTGEQLALGLCRKHYDRQRKYGCAEFTKPSGGPRTAPEELEAAGISARQRNYWASNGVIPVIQSDGGRYLWNDDSIRMALIVQRLSPAGMSVPHAGVVAQAIVRHKARRVELFSGVSIVVDEDFEPDPDPLA